MNTPSHLCDDSMSTTPTVTKCPPGAARGSEPSPQFHDSKARKSIHSTRNPDGTFNTTGLDVSDVYQSDGGARMHMEKRTQTPGRKNPIPPWVFNDELTRQVISEYVIARAKNGHSAHRKTDKTVSARFTEACEKSKLIVPDLKNKLIELCNEYRRQALAGATKDKLKEILVQVRNLESSIKLHERGVAAIATAIVYFYYRVGYNSVQIAEHFNLTSWGVRQILTRLNKAWWFIQHPGETWRPGADRVRNQRKQRKRASREAQVAARMAEDIDAELNEFVNEMTGQELQLPSHSERQMR